MDIDLAVARDLGFPKLKYAQVERERRWLCRTPPTDRIVRSDAIIDLYVDGGGLRLREATPLNGGPVTRKLGRKGDVDRYTRLTTSIYLSEAEFGLLSNLPGKRLRKVRHHLTPVGGFAYGVDLFEGDLAGLILAETEFATPEAMAACPGPDFAVREVTDDPRYAGGWLAAHGLPPGAV
jgi:CYTH domain-containing protein